MQVSKFSRTPFLQNSSCGCFWTKYWVNCMQINLQKLAWLLHNNKDYTTIFIFELSSLKPWWLCTNKKKKTPNVQKWSFPLRISSVNVTKPKKTADLVIFTEQILSGKLHFLYSGLYLFFKNSSANYLQYSQLTGLN